MTQTIQEVFKQFCKERHAEDKGRNHDLLQEIYASTEFFDMEFLDDINEQVKLSNYVHTPKNSKADFPIENFSLPFQSVFIRYDEQCHIFLREYAPDVITGTLYITECYFEEVSRGTIGEGILNCPFTIHLSNVISRPSVVINYNWFSVDDSTGEDEDSTSDLQVIIKVCEVLDKLSHKAIAVDKPSNPNLHEYYRRKRKPTIKIPHRPISYILGDKKEDVTPKYKNIRVIGNLEYSYSFHVRGHWRRIGEKTLGKDRNGNYNMHGYTWVTEYIKGEGELAKRIRVVK